MRCLGEGDDLVLPEVELVVAERHGLVAALVEHLDGRVALRVVHEAAALGDVAGVEQQHVVALGLVVVDELHRGGKAQRLLVQQVVAVRVVGVHDGELARTARRGAGLRASAGRALLRAAVGDQCGRGGCGALDEASARNVAAHARLLTARLGVAPHWGVAPVAQLSPVNYYAAAPCGVPVCAAFVRLAPAAVRPAAERGHFARDYDDANWRSTCERNAYGKAYGHSRALPVRPG